jgi:hypothetical protein
LSGGSGGLPADIAGIRAAQSSYVFGGKRPYGLTWTFGVQRAFGNSYTAEVRYTGTKGVHLWNQPRLNAVSPVTASLYLPTYMIMPSTATLAGLTTTLGDIQKVPNNKTRSLESPIISPATLHSPTLPTTAWPCN